MSMAIDAPNSRALIQAKWYDRNLATSEFKWGQVLSDEPLEFDGSELISKGPWYIDVNHRESALLIGPFVLWTSSDFPGLVDKTIQIDMKLDYSSWLNEYDARRGGQLVFWFQAEIERGVAGGAYTMPNRYVNYVRPVNILAHAEDGRPVEIDLPVSLDSWMCLGRNQIDTRDFIGSAAKYTCALNTDEFRKAMESATEVGVLFLLPRFDEFGNELAYLNASYPNRTSTMGNSTFYLRKFVIQSSR